MPDNTAAVEIPDGFPPGLPPIVYQYARNYAVRGYAPVTGIKVLRAEMTALTDLLEKLEARFDAGKDIEQDQAVTGSVIDFRARRKALQSRLQGESA